MCIIYNNMTASAGANGEVIVTAGMNGEYDWLCFSIFPCSICCATPRMLSYSSQRSSLLSFFLFSIYLVFFFILIIFSHFLHPITAVKWPIVKEQTVCVWDISCWFSGTLAWWMARQKTPNNSWFASGETCSLRRNTVQHSHLLCSVSNDDGRGTVLQRMKPRVLYSSKLAVLEHFNSYYPGLFVKYIGH